MAWRQAMTWANVDPDLSRHVASLGRNELAVHGVFKIFLANCNLAVIFYVCLQQRHVKVVMENKSIIVGKKSTEKCLLSLIPKSYIRLRTKCCMNYGFDLNYNDCIW